MKIYDLVHMLLTKYPKLRDSDKLLIWNVWGYQGIISPIGHLYRRDFIESSVSPESIRRCRQKIQETNPELRSSKRIQKEKDRKEADKGTFIYREEVNV